MKDLLRKLNQANKDDDTIEFVVAAMYVAKKLSEEKERNPEEWGFSLDDLSAIDNDFLSELLLLGLTVKMQTMAKKEGFKI